MKNTYRDLNGATASRLVRVYDDEGAVCSLNAAAPGVLYDPITGNPMTQHTEKWFRAVERLYALDGVAEEMQRRDEEEAAAQAKFDELRERLEDGDIDARAEVKALYDEGAPDAA